MQAEESIMTEKGSYWQVKTTLKEFSQAKKRSLVCAKIAKNFFSFSNKLELAFKLDWNFAVKTW